MPNKASILELLKIIAPILPAPIYWEDRNSVLLGGNEAVFSATGAMLAEAYVGKSLFELYPIEMAEHIKRHNEEVMGTGKTLAQEEAIRDIASGKLKYFTAIKAPLRDDKGNIIGIVGTSIDITEQKKLLEDLQLAKENAEAANLAKTEFIANMSHDIRTPLSGIIGMSRFLEDKASNPEEKQYARWVNESGEQLLKLLNGVLDVVSAAHLSEDDIATECFNLRESVEDIVQLEQPTIGTKKLEFKVDIDKNIPTYVVCDRFKLNRILLNLVGNAIKFTQKGYISLKIEQVNQSQDKVELKFSVSDTGPGIPKSLQSKVFEQFYRITPSYQSEYHGHGVGLHIVEKYVTLLNGKIYLDSDENKGTTFYFTIPLIIGKEENSINYSLPKISNTENHHFENKKNYTVNSEQSRATLLLVEDNEIALRMIEMNAEIAGCDYTSATTAEAAFELTNSKNFDLIITDIGLPGISGNELTRKIRLREKNLARQPIPIIGLTAHAIVEAEGESIQAGMNQVLSKPIKLNVLQSILSQLLPNKFKPSFSNEDKDKDKPKQSILFHLPSDEKKLFLLDEYPLLEVKKSIENLGNEVILNNLLRSLIVEELPQALIRLKEAYHQKDWIKIEKLAHNIKSGALYCGTTKLKYACQYFEWYQKTGHIELLEQLFNQLIQVIHDTNYEIKKWLK